MGDEGLPVGGCLLYLHTRDGAQTWHRQRYPLRRLYLGRDYAAQFDAAAKTFTRIMADTERPVEKAVDLLARGAVVAIYTDRMEFGPRALGARSILASPVEREVNDAINKRLERSEFMPFAPVVLEDEAATVFDINAGNAHAARFMTITCAVHPDWQNKIPAVVHVDGSARPQTIRREDNPLYYDVLAQFYARTGLPVLVNTSFNVHEEPIVDTPAQALKSLADGRIDHILTSTRFIRPSAELTSRPWPLGSRQNRTQRTIRYGQGRVDQDQNGVERRHRLLLRGQEELPHQDRQARQKEIRPNC